jgi:hypothetical protein
MVVSVLTPAYLQTDQYRYVWDGLNIVNGINPYRFSPADNPLFNSFNWTSLINHPKLSTIYPPVSELLFAISTYLNPYFIFDHSLSITDPGQVLYGLKVLYGVLICILVFIFRKYRWDLVIANPLFLYTFA